MTSKISFAVSFLLSKISASSIQIVHPTELKNEFSSMVDGKYQSGFMDSSLGNFGHFDYGTTIKGRVNYPLENTDGCDPFTMDDFEFDIINHEQYNNRGHTPIIMVDRGNCHFVQKAQNAQKFGAAMLLVIDNKWEEQPKNLVMADDGMGSSVYIPSFIIKKTDGEILKDAVETWEHAKETNDGSARQEKVVIQADISVATKTKGMIDVDLWYTGAFEFRTAGWNFKDLAEMQSIFTHRLMFEPRTIINRCSKGACSKEEKNTLCINDGKYCPVYPSNIQNLDNGDSLPLNLITQSIREQCVFQALQPNKKAHWFKYMDMILKNCVAHNETNLKPVSQQCHDKIISDLIIQPSPFDIDQQRFTTCVSTQKNLVTTSQNYDSYFDEDLEVSQSVGSIFHPTISINNHTYRGEYDNSNDLFKSICSVMYDRPDICSTFSLGGSIPTVDGKNAAHTVDQQAADEFARRKADQRYKEFDKSLTGMSKRAKGAEIMLGLTIVCIINCSCLLFFKMYNKKEATSDMQAQVNEQVSQYFALASFDDTERTNRSGGSSQN